MVTEEHVSRGDIFRSQLAVIHTLFLCVAPLMLKTVTLWLIS